MERKLHARIVCALVLFFTYSTSHAAFVSAQTSATVLNPAETAQVLLFLNHQPGEVSSVFEGVFDLEGLGTVANATLTEGGPTWPNRFGNILSDRALLSLTSNNDGTVSRLIATLDVTAQTPGFFNVRYSADSFAAFDIAVSPFVQDLPITNTDAELLAQIQVVPIPPALLLFASALGGFSLISRRRRSWGGES